MNTHKYMRITGNALCLLAIGGSLLTGCGLPGGEEGQGIPGDAKTRIQADLSGAGAECETGDIALETLQQRMPDGELCRAVAAAAGIAESDTGDTLPQKLEQCQSLTLNQDAVYSLEGLGEALPNLRELNIAYDPWEYPQIEDYSPIGELSHLEELRIVWPAGELSLIHI